MVRFLILLVMFFSVDLQAQPLDDVRIAELIAQYKTEARGPYKDIRWFCKGGKTVSPQERCPEPGGLQRARYRDEVIALGKSNHVFLGQILSMTDQQDFWDAGRNHSRLKQYQLEKYLRANDDGWVLRKGQYYRGAFQAEDEQAWGKEFFIKMLSNDENLNKHFYLLREALKDIPHRDDSDRTQQVRALSKTISDEYSPFMDLRVKIHGQPDISDLKAVKDFRAKYQAKLSASLLKKFDILIADMEAVYSEVDLHSLDVYLRLLPKDAMIRAQIESFIAKYADGGNPQARTMAAAELLYEIRNQVLTVPGGKARLALLDISLELESLVFREVYAWETDDLEALLGKVCYLGHAMAGTGLVELWEWRSLSGKLSVPEGPSITLRQLNAYQENGRSLIEWGSSMVRATYGDVIALYAGFEPMAYGFFDDRIRSSILLPMGESVSKLGDFAAVQASLSNKVLGIPDQSSMRGINPGYALGTLVVISNATEHMEVSNDKIYVFDRPPSDLKPVAGIATVSEGNMVSHVQLLARNLGIPNAVLSDKNLEALKKFSGKKVFYAVSNKGTVIMKEAADMTPEEQKLFAVKKRDENKISVPESRIRLDQTSILDLRELDATASGKLCGPKAANLAQLKVMFPDRVVEGLVIPFGIFRKHMDQPMPGQQQSYWQYLTDVFDRAAAMRDKGRDDAAIESFVLTSMDTLRQAILKIELLPSFTAELDSRFTSILGAPMGKVPVFLRSDTNMEDLKEFTGAGLNLTLFNVVDRARIIQGIKDVWASPYTERSYKWRQRYLLNPENVYPSILIIPSVDVDFSGVMITKGIASNNDADITIAFSRGAGGAVDGQAAESYLLRASGTNTLLSPAREPFYNRLPVTGGTERRTATFESSILHQGNVQKIRELSAEVRAKLPSAPGVDTEGPFDVELGFQNDQLWLFQVRPFVENKRALSSEYLQSITPAIPLDKVIQLSTPL